MGAACRRWCGVSGRSGGWQLRGHGVAVLRGLLSVCDLWKCLAGREELLGVYFV